MGYTGNYNLYYPSGSQPINPVGGGDNGQFFMMMQSVDELFWSVEQIATQAKDSADASAQSAADSASDAQAARVSADKALNEVTSIPDGYTNVGWTTDNKPYVIDNAVMPIRGQGSPVGVVTPVGPGQPYYDMTGTNGAWEWISTGTTDQDWTTVLTAGVQPKDSTLVVAEAVNYVTNPRMVSTDGTVVVDTNYFPDPFFEYGTAGYATTANVDYSRVASPDADGHALQAKMLSAGPPDNITFPGSATTGQQMTATAQVWIPSTNTDGSGGALRIGGGQVNSGSGGSDESIRDQWQTVTVTVDVIADSGSLVLYLYPPNNADESVYFKGICWRVAGFAVPPFSGDSTADDTFAYAWTGTPGASASTRVAVAPSGWSVAGGEGGGILYRNGDGNAVLRCGTRYAYASTGISGGDQTALVDTITASADCSIYLYNASNIGGRRLLDLQAGVPTSLRENIHGNPNSTIYLGWSTGAATPGETLTFNRVLVTDGNDYTGPYFDGDTPDTAVSRFKWSGEPNASTSLSGRPVTVWTN